MESALAGEARRPRIRPVCEGGATLASRMPRSSNAAGRSQRAAWLDRVLANRRQKAFAQVVCLAGAHAFDRAKGVE